MSLPVAIIGAGLAGTTLAWRLREAGIPSILFDRRDPGAASRAAAGLITPVTGLRLAKSWRFERLWPIAVAFYRHVERIIGETILFEHPALRLFQNDAERTLCQQKSDPGLVADHSIGAFTSPASEIPPGFIQPLGGVEFAPAGHLAVQRYLSLSHRFFNVIEADIHSDAISISDDAVRIEGESYRAVVFCQGYSGCGNPFFPEIKFNPTKGDILTLEIPEFDERRTVHSTGWLMQTQPGLYAVGSTYERVRLDPQPTTEGRAEVERKVNGMLRVPYRVIDHRAGIRPTIRESQPTVMESPQSRRVLLFNGLGSKGSLVAPAYAGEVVGRIEE